MNHLTLIHSRKRRVTHFHVHLVVVPPSYTRLEPLPYTIPILRTLLNNIYRVRRSHCGIRDIESGLSEGSVSSLKKLLKVQELSELFDDEQSATTEGECLSTSESHLEVKFAAIIETFYDKLKEDPEFTCCSCQKLLLKKVLISFKSSTWEQLKNYFRERDPEVSTQELYICKDCRPVLNADNIPPRSVLNGLYTEPVPEELANLTPLETQFIQRAKCFQTVVRLDTYTGKVPTYNHMKGVKGTMFFYHCHSKTRWIGWMKLGLGTVFCR